MGIYVVLALTFGFVILSAVVSIRTLKLRNTGLDRMPRGILAAGNQIVLQQVVVFTIVIIAGYFADISLYDLGLSQTFHPIPAFLAGFIVYFIVLQIIDLLAHGLGVHERLQEVSYETIRLVWPRKKREKVLAFVAICLINPFTEEVLYRGVLVHLFGGLIESLLLAAAIGLVLSVLAHMYQGAWSIPFQLIFHAAAIGLLLSPFGLAACFGFHFAGDLIPVLTIRRSMKEFRSLKRKERGLVVEHE